MPYGNQAVSYRLINVKSFPFKPKADITAYELAQVLENMQLTVSEKILNGWPPEMARHFKKEEQS